MWDLIVAMFWFMLGICVAILVFCIIMYAISVAVYWIVSLLVQSFNKLRRKL
jgi:hypothetical protein